MDDVVLNVESSKMKIFVTGKFGVGKSTFTNGLFSGKVEAEIGVSSTNIRSFTFENNAESLVVYDTPGQELNSTSYLQWIQQNCNDIDLVLFCIQMTDQVRPEDIQALASLTKTFGMRVWNRLVIVLTHANQVTPVDPRKESKDAYYNRIKFAMVARIKDILKDPAYGIGVSASLANGLPILPVGHPRDYSLSDCSDWRAAVVDASSTCVGKPLLEQFVRNDALRVTHCVATSCVSEPDPRFWQKIMLGSLCIVGGVILVFLSRPAVGVPLGFIGGGICYVTLHGQSKIVYVEQVL